MMSSDTETWKVKAAAKRANTLAKIYPQWRLSPGDIARASSQRDLTEPFIQQFLDPEDISIVSMDSLPIVNAIKQRSLTSLEVATAFCKAAAIAHQIVSSSSNWLSPIRWLWMCSLHPILPGFSDNC